MNPIEQQDTAGKEERYRRTQEDVKQINSKVDKLTGVVGGLETAVRDLGTALTGNDFGTEGIVGQLKNMRDDIERLDKKQDAMQLSIERNEMNIKNRQKLLMGCVAACSTVFGIVLKVALEYFFKK